MLHKANGKVITNAFPQRHKVPNFTERVILLVKLRLLGWQFQFAEPSWDCVWRSCTSWNMLRVKSPTVTKIVWARNRTNFCCLRLVLNCSSTKFYHDRSWETIYAVEALWMFSTEGNCSNRDIKGLLTWCIGPRRKKRKGSLDMCDICALENHLKPHISDSFSTKKRATWDASTSSSAMALRWIKMMQVDAKYIGQRGKEVAFAHVWFLKCVSRNHDTNLSW